MIMGKSVIIIYGKLLIEVGGASLPFTIGPF